jgi:hypothetical protein
MNRRLPNAFRTLLRLTSLRAARHRYGSGRHHPHRRRRRRLGQRADRLWHRAHRDRLVALRPRPARGRDARHPLLGCIAAADTAGDLARHRMAAGPPVHPAGSCRRADRHAAGVEGRCASLQDRRRPLSRALYRLCASPQETDAPRARRGDRRRHRRPLRRHSRRSRGRFRSAGHPLDRHPRRYQGLQRSILQTFNLAILGAALVSHAWSGLVTREVGLAALAAVPGSIAGAWVGAEIYKRLGDRGFARIVLGLLFLSGVVLIWTSR